MKTIFYDFETYYEPGSYTLRTMPPTLYIRDERFKCLGCAIAVDDEPAVWYPDDTWVDFAEANMDALWVCHNGLFDPLILTHHYNLKPAKYGDTLAMARYLLQIKSHSLANVATVLGLQAKGDMDQALKDGTLDEYATGDVDICRGIYRLLADMMTADEAETINITLRWFAEPTLELDVPLLEDYLTELDAARNKLIQDSGTTEDVLASNPRFDKHIRSLGMTPPTKISKATQEEAVAFAKNDPEFILFRAKYPEHEPLWLGRQAVKSTINQSRTRTFIDHKTTMPMPLNYWGAHTGRFSGAGKVNIQNLPRGGTLRKALKAPKGYKVYASDAAQIELRFNLWFCGQTDMLEILIHQDLYKYVASQHFRVTIDEITKDQRQFGKVLSLGLGFGMGHVRFRAFCASGPLGQPPLYLTELESITTVMAYRATHYAIAGMWAQLNTIILLMASTTKPVPFKCVTVHKEAIELPNGTFLFYPDLEQGNDGSWMYGPEGKRKFIHGASLLENIIQALARVLLVHHLLIAEKEGFHTVSTTHDEIIGIAPEAEAEATVARLAEIMSQPAEWCSDLLLSAEASFGDNYGECK